MDPSWRWPIFQRCRRSVGRSSCKPKKPSFWDSEDLFFQTQSVNSESCKSFLFAIKGVKRHLKQKSSQPKMVNWWPIVTIFFLLSSPICKFPGSHLFANHAIEFFLPAWGSQHSRLEVTADHRVVMVTHEGEKRQVAESWPKKLGFKWLPFWFRVQEDKVLSTPASRDCVFR